MKLSSLKRFELVLAKKKSTESSNFFGCIIVLRVHDFRRFSRSFPRCLSVLAHMHCKDKLLLDNTSIFV